MNDQDRQYSILAVDDDPDALRTIVAILKMDATYDVHQAGSAMEAVRVFREGSPDLVVCGFRGLPDCIGLMQRIKETPGPVLPAFLIIYERTQFPDFAKGHENGADDYIERLLLKKVLLLKIRNLLRTRALKEELKEEKKRLEIANEQLERNFKELTAILLNILEVRMPGASDRAETAKNAAEFVVHKLGLEKEERKNIIFAALLHEMGKVGLPDEVAAKRYNTVPPALLPLFQQYATVGSMIISTVTGFKESAEAVYHQLENYDGTGFPDGLIGDQIPLAARVLRAILFAEDLLGQGRSYEDAIDGVRYAMHTALDPRVANPLIEFLYEHAKSGDNRRLKLSVEALEPGMVVAEDVYASSGIKLIPKGVKLQERMLSLLIERNKTDPIVGGVYIAVAK